MTIMEDNYDRDADLNADLITRTLITPAIENYEDETTGTPPLSARAYLTLTEVSKDRVKKAAAMRDNRETVIAPMGGQVSVGYSNMFGENVLDDICAVPTEGPMLMPSQIPLIVDNKPAAEHNVEKEFDFGRLPKHSDYVDSCEGQEKPEEQVLAVPAADFVNAMLSITEEDATKPNELNEAVYLALNFLRRGWCEKDERFIQLLPYIVFFKKVAGKYKIFVYQRGKGVGEERLAGGCSIGVGGHINPLDFLSVQSKYEKSYFPSGPQLLPQFTGRVLCEGFWTGILNNVVRENREEVEMRTYGRGVAGAVVTETYVKHDIMEIIGGGAEKEGVTMEQWLHRRTTFFLDYAAGQVEKVHLGMFIGIEVPESFEITTNEEDLIDVGFLDLDDLRDDSKVPTPIECWSRSIISSLTGTIDMLVLRPQGVRYGSRFVNEALSRDGQHLVEAEFVAQILPEDRWKIGTLAQIFDPAFKFYAMNAFLRA